jgi:endonuclease YncB( thermonuclease family)
MHHLIYAAAVAVAGTFAIASEQASAQTGSVVVGRPYVTDGDTLRIGRVRLRLQGIQAPEMDTAEGQEARRQLIALIGRAEVRCVDSGQRSYDRIVARCFIGRDDVAGLLVARGWARDWPRFSGRRYAAAEAAARGAGRGLHSR